MLPKTPRHLPSLADTLLSLGQPHPRAIARALGVCERTVWKWLSDGAAPRPAHLALFWPSAYGLSEINSDREALLTNLHGWVQCLQGENRALKTEIGRVLALSQHGAANTPSWRNLPMAPVISLHPLAQLGDTESHRAGRPGLDHEIA